MKQAYFIFLLIISFQGFSQSVKVKEIGLEVMTEDLGDMDWRDAKNACRNLGNGWRLPTKDELNKMYAHRNSIGGLNQYEYWSSEQSAIDANAWYFDTLWGRAYNTNKNRYLYVRAVRNLK
jgi:hypothetical protein